MTSMMGRLLICALLPLAGCSYTHSLAPKNSKSISEASPLSSEQTYRAMLPVLRDCYGAGMVIESNYFPEAKEGEILIAMTGETVRVEFAKMTIAPSGSGSVVTMVRRTGLANADGFDQALPEWILGKDGRCPLGTKYEPPRNPSHNPYSNAASR